MMNPYQFNQFCQQPYSKLHSYRDHWKDNVLSLIQKACIPNTDQLSCYDNSIEVCPKAYAFRKTLSLYNLINRRYSLQECDIQVLLNEVIHDLKYLAQQRNILIRVYGDKSIKVFSSPELLKLIFHNLLENSIIYSKPDHHYAYVEVDCSLVNGQLSITVEDNGIGIGDDLLPFIFQPLLMEEMAGKKKGLGVYLVKKALDLMQGTIQVESVAGCYTKMRVVLNFID